MIGPNLRGVWPNNRSAADQMAMNTLPINIPPGKRYSRAVMLANSRPTGGGRVPQRIPVEVAQLPEPSRRGGGGMWVGQQLALVTPPPPPPAAPRGGFRLISTANAADASPARREPVGSGQWAIQVGAFTNQGQANSALTSARSAAHVELAVARTSLASVHQGRGILWRARMTGMSRDTAIQACEKITRSRSNCIVLSPDAQF
jgi:hypothetical protein